MLNLFSFCINIAFHSVTDSISVMYKKKHSAHSAAALLLHLSRSLFKLFVSIDIYLSSASAQQHFKIKKKLILKKINSELSSVQLRDYPHSEKFQRCQFQHCFSFHSDSPVHFNSQTELKNQ